MAVSAKVASAYVDLVARTEAFEKALGDAASSTRKFKAIVQAEMKEAKGSIALLGEELSVHLPRHLQTFIAKLPGVSSAMSAAFDTVAVIAMIDIVVKAGEKIYEFAEKNEKAAKKNAEAWDAVNKPLATSNDELRVTNDRLEDSIAKLEGKPSNGLKTAIDEAIVSADKLSAKLDADLKKIEDVLKASSPSMFGAQLFKGQASTKDIEDKYADLQSRIQGTTQSGNDAIRAARGSKDPLALKAAQDDLNKKLSDLYTEGANFAKTVIDTARLAQVAQKNPNAYPVSYRTGFNAQDMGPRIQDASGLLSFFNSQQDALDLGNQNTALNTKKGSLEQQKQLAEEEAKRQKAFGAMVLSMVRENQFAGQESDRINEALVKTFVEGEKQDREQEARIQRAVLQTFEAAEKQQKAAEQIEEARIKLEVARGRLSALEGAKAMQALHQSSNADWLASAQDLGAQGIPVPNAAQHMREAGVQGLMDAQNVLDNTWRGMVDNVFDELIKKSENTSKQIEQLALRMVDEINGELAKGMTGGKMDFSKIFDSASQSLAKTGLEKAEGAGLKALGLGSGHKNADGYHMWVDNLPGGASGSASSGLVGAAGKGLLGMLNDSNFLGSLFGGRVFGAGSIFGGGHALGGDVAAGVPIDVGELGRERFTPSVPGRITPHNQLGGGNVWNIDARGTDPALTRENFQNALVATHHAAVANTMRMMQDHQRRVPA
jgi:hypothetical protein